MGFTYLFMFVLVEELGSPAYPEDFQEIEVKEEPMEYDAVSCDLFKHINMIRWSVTKKIKSFQY